MKLRHSPNFSIKIPKNKNIDSFIRMAKEYGMIYEIYHDEFTGEEKVGIWEKAKI